MASHGIRADNWARANPRCVEEDKEGHELGCYRHPELQEFGHDNEVALIYLSKMRELEPA